MSGLSRPRVVLVGGSAGALDALGHVLGGLPAGYPLPVLLVCHVHQRDDGHLARHLDERLALPVQEARDKEPIVPSRVFVAPADYHLLVERDGNLALSSDARVNWSRPAIDVLFESAAWAWGPKVLCVVLSGANMDGAQGALAVQERGGTVVIQHPATARHPEMPLAAAAATGCTRMLAPDAICALLLGIARTNDEPSSRNTPPSGGAAP